MEQAKCQSQTTKVHMRGMPMSRIFLLFSSVVGGMLMTCHAIFAQVNEEILLPRSQATIEAIKMRLRAIVEENRSVPPAEVETLTEISRKTEIPIIVKFVGEEHKSSQETDVFLSEYRAYVQHHRYRLNENFDIRRSVFQSDTWIVSVEHPRWKSEHDFVHGIALNTSNVPVFYLFVSDSSRQFLAWRCTEYIRFKDISEPEDKKSLLENRINRGVFDSDIYRLTIRSDLAAELRNAKTNSIEIVDISVNENDVLSSQVKLRGPKSGHIYVYVPIREGDTDAGIVVFYSVFGKLAPGAIVWKQSAIIDTIPAASTSSHATPSIFAQ
jgi:hypothetical protein